MTNQTKRLNETERAEGRRKALEHFQSLDDIWCDAMGDAISLDLIRQDSDLDLDTAIRTMNACAFYLKKHLNALDEHVQACYREVRRSWGYDD